MKKLSAYTVASNCTDLTDIRDGIAEIHEAMKACVESGKRIPSFYRDSHLLPPPKSSV